MANKINRQDIYPNTVPDFGDFVLGVDVSNKAVDPNGQVVTFTLDDIRDTISADIGAEVAASEEVTAAIALSQAWAEGTEPGGPGTKSSEEHAADSATSAAQAALYDGPWLANSAAIDTDETLSYGPGASGVSEGDTVQTREDRFSFRVLAEDADPFDKDTNPTGYHRITGGGVKLEVLSRDLAAFNPVGDGVADDSDAIEKWLSSVGNTDYGSGDFPAASPPRGAMLTAPEGEYRFTRTLPTPNNVVIQGAGWGTKFKFDPSALASDAFKLRTYSGSAINAVSVRFKDCMIHVAPDGGTATGRNGGALNTVNPNARHGINAENATGVSCENVFFGSFHYGRGFHSDTNNVSFAYYNYLQGCTFRDCWQGYKLTSASRAQACYVGHSDRYPAQSRMGEHEYAVDLTNAAGCTTSGSVECYASIALIKDNGRGHDFSGLYLEGFSPTPHMFDCSEMPATALSLSHAATSYGYGYGHVVNELIQRSASDNQNWGQNFNTGDYEEIEVEHYTTRQSPSFKYDLPGRSHYPAGGTLAVSTDSFIGETAIELTRGAGTNTDNNQVSYNFKLRKGKKQLTNVFVAVLVKLEGGEDNVSIGTLTPNVNFKKWFTYSNGWALYGNYLSPSEDATLTLKMAQLPGSTDPARKLKLTALRVYANGFAPIPGPYKWDEYRTAAPTAGDWVRGDIVWNAQPIAGGAPGWVCTTSGSPGTWKAMASLAV